MASDLSALSVDELGARVVHRMVLPSEKAALFELATRANERDRLAEAHRELEKVLKWYAVDVRIGYKARKALASLSNSDGEA